MVMILFHKCGFYNFNKENLKHNKKIKKKKLSSILSFLSSGGIKGYNAVCLPSGKFSPQFSGNYILNGN